MTSARVGPVLYQVWVNGIPYGNAPRILDAELWMSFGEHDIFFLRTEVARQVPVASLSIWPDDTPIKIQWGRSPDLKMWYGYVNHSQVSSNADSGTNAAQIEYVCIGTSQVLNPDTSRLWTNVTPTYIAKQIAAENNLRAVVSTSTWVIDSESQANQSNFDFLNYIANKTGMRFWCSGGTLYMVDPDIQLIGSHAAAAPVYNANKLPTTQDTCRNFTMLKGNNIPGAVVANRAIYGVDLVTGQPFSAVTTPSSTTQRTVIKHDTSVTSYYDAQQRITASAALSQFSTQATAQVFGNSSLYPGKVINLQGVALPTGASGDWLITCTRHKLLVSYSGNPAKDIYVTDVNLCRNTPTGLNLTNVQPIIPEFTTCGLSRYSTGTQWTCFNPTVVTEATV